MVLPATVPNHYTGAYAELLVSAYLTSQHCDVFRPDNTHGRSDLIYIKDNKPVKVQVKTTVRTINRNGWLYENCKIAIYRKNYRLLYSPAEIDEMWIVGTHLWCIPMGELEGLSNLFLCSNNPEPKYVRDKSYNTDDFIMVKGSWDRPFKTRLEYQDNGEGIGPRFQDKDSRIRIAKSSEGSRISSLKLETKEDLEDIV